ncbi:hypothetical protein BKA66DRAFT_293510 [Pyrenochaeta sp. MPI-SDFR-AT-0127]|nr:hypothetical protein BKA66DRAFT_293510 [Pyrenochaeta sp. MPI-SDFR-AT-0127]
MASVAQLEFVTVDVFTSKPYEGNPLGIVRVPHGASVTQEQKQAIAREFNLSETTFLHEKGPNAEDEPWTVDIFMTTRELPFAGHPTIGTACYILGRTVLERGIRDGIVDASFNLKAGLVGLRYDVAKKTARASIPHNVRIHKKRYTRDELFALQPQLADAHQQSTIQAREDYSVVSIVKGMTFALVELESLEALELVTVASRSLTITGLDDGWNETFVGTYFFVRTGKSKEGATAVRTRMIEGSLEDPATGSAASALAAYLSLTEGKPSEHLKFEIVQGVEMGRRSEIFVEIVLTESRAISELYLEGEAVQVMEGRLTI